MSCNGCRVLRRRCSEPCILRPCLDWIPSPQSQGFATLFLSKFFGRSDLLSFIAAVPESNRPALFQSLLYEACGRTVNPVGGAVGLLSTGNWRECQSAVETVLTGGTLRPVVAGTLRNESPGPFLTPSNPIIFGAGKGGGAMNCAPEKQPAGAGMWLKWEESGTMMSFGGGDCGVQNFKAQDPKLLNLFV
ncbi:LOB domain-containing protein 38-like [Diospyros lotus]|uniref:LOB domain-containing protein 38-like n=1 Tax=Diospyros lotus TaxID=55363 RepID=UPI00225361EE|nr:LOB domain-containing protein 38-like [Diospyros lotus]